jgi:hypothetical protein
MVRELQAHFAYKYGIFPLHLTQPSEGNKQLNEEQSREAERARSSRGKATSHHMGYLHQKGCKVLLCNFLNFYVMMIWNM